MGKKSRTAGAVLLLLALLWLCAMTAGIWLAAAGGGWAALLLTAAALLCGAAITVLFVRPLLSARGRAEARGVEEVLRALGLEGADYLELLLSGRWVDAAAAYRQYMEEAYNDRETASQIRFSILQHQINPHFLYNTLESVRGLAYMDGADNAAEMAEALAAFFRYSISSGEEIVPLSRELNNIKRYFVIQKYRFSSRFRLQLRLEESDAALTTYPIPKLMLQPLVENALFHGLERKTGPGCVAISAEYTVGRLYLYVEDDGVGMAEEAVKRLNTLLYGGKTVETPERQTGAGIALWNINQRIHSLYGEEYGLNFESTAGEGTRVEIALPWPAPEWGAE